MKASPFPTPPLKSAVPPSEDEAITKTPGAGGAAAVTPGYAGPEAPPMIPRELVMVGSKLEAQSIFRSPYYFPSFQFPYNPDPLCKGNSYRIYDEMQDDDQIKSALAVKKDMVVNTGWQVVCDDDQIKEFLTDALKRINQTTGTGAGGFDDVLRDILSSYAYGFSMSEPVYRLDKTMGLWTFSELRTRPPHSFRFPINDRGDVTQVEQIGSDKTHIFGMDTFIHHAYQMEFGNPYGRSDLRAAHTSWVAKKFVMRFYNVYLERYASPTIVGKYKPTFTKTDIAELLSILQQMQQNTSMVIPEDALVDFVQSQRDSSGSYAEALDKYDTKIARALLMPDLLGFSGGHTKGGSFALGKEQFKAFLGIIKKDRESLQNKITERMLKPLVTVNWGEEAAKTVSFEFIPFRDESIIEAVNVWSNAVKNVGWKPNDDEINYLRAAMGFPEGDVERNAPPVQLDPQGNPIDPMSPKGGAMSGASGDDEPGDATAKGGNKAVTKAFNLRTYTSRKMTAYEKKVDFGGVLDVLDTSERRALPALRRAAKAISSDLIGQVRDRGILRRFKPELVNEIQPRFLKDLKMVFRNHFKDLFNGAVKGAKAEIYKDVKKFASEDDTMLPEDFLRILEAESFKVTGDYSTEITKRARNIIMQGIKDGVAESQIVTLLRDELDSYTETWLSTVIRTKTTEIYNDARKSFWDSDPIAKQVIEAYQFSAILDDRTTDVCRELDGQIFDKGDFLDKITPPLHFNCRSLLVPVTRFEPYKDDPDYVKPGDEPSFEELKKMGGGFIVGGD